ncbi:hypothetical protein FD755_021678 [Muntiacus reevesi]|uniref:RBR-type E3 ubiquitin transferase n=1 Tax=Muntiacus reevesi TaxID=9886 RepID=A0A5N3W249_MUNRE|nr:hypothetical protein FD755_021678 [Muntiacus reevesi]
MKNLPAMQETWVQLGQVEIKCPITECFEFLEETMVVYNLTHEDSIKYKYFLELGRIDASTKPCPQCKHFTTFKKKGHIPTPSRSESKYKIQCPTCQFVWCFKCHSPWHEGVNCKEYKKGDKLLRHWASEIERGQRNAQKCPKCKVRTASGEGVTERPCLHRHLSRDLDVESQPCSQPGKGISPIEKSAHKSITPLVLRLFQMAASIALYTYFSPIEGQWQNEAFPPSSCLFSLFRAAAPVSLIFPLFK